MYSIYDSMLLYRPQQIIDKLLRGTSGNSAMALLPFVGFRAKFVIRYGEACTVSQLYHNVEVLLLGRLGVVNGHAETVYQGQLLLHGIRAVHAVLALYIVTVAPVFLDEMSAVGGCIDQDIVRLGLHAALNHCL